MSPQDVANSAYGLALLSFDTQNPEDAAFRLGLVLGSGLGLG
jgi:hypothetical protein